MYSKQFRSGQRRANAKPIRRHGGDTKALTAVPGRQGVGMQCPAALLALTTATRRTCGRLGIAAAAFSAPNSSSLLQGGR